MNLKKRHKSKLIFESTQKDKQPQHQVAYEHNKLTNSIYSHEAHVLLLLICVENNDLSLDIHLLLEWIKKHILIVQILLLILSSSCRLILCRHCFRYFITKLSSTRFFFYFVLFILPQSKTTFAGFWTLLHIFFYLASQLFEF